MTIVTDDLKALGLSDNEASVYLAVLKNGTGKAGELIRETGMHRNLVYQALEKLASRRLVAKSIRGGVAHFQATDVEHLRDDVREKDMVASRLIESLKERSRLGDQEIAVYEGDDAIRTFFLRIASGLADGERIHMLGSAGAQFEDALGPGALKRFFAEIRTRGGGMRVLMHRRQGLGETTAKAAKENSDVETRSLPFDAAPTANIVFTDSLVAFHILEKPYTVIEIRNAHLVAAYRTYFDLLWRQNVRVEQGMDALHDAFYGMVDALRPGEGYRVLGGNMGKEYERLSGFFGDMHRYRIEHGVTADILAQHDSAASIRERTRRYDPDDRVSHVRSFQTPFLSPMQINLYQGKAVMIIYKEEPTVLYFEDKEVVDGFGLYFDEIWNRQTYALRGREGIVALCEQVLEEGKDLYHIAATGFILKRHAEYYRDFTERRVSKGLRLLMLANDDTRGTALAKMPLSETRYLPKAFASPMVIWIFGEYVAHVLWHEPETIFMIKDAKTAGYYRQYYEALKLTTRP